MTTEPTHSRSGQPRADRVRTVRRGARLPAGLRAVLGRRGVLRARDGPPPAGLRRGTGHRPESVRRHPAAVRRPGPVRVRPEPDVPRRARRAHACGHLLGLRPAHDRDRQHRHGRPDRKRAVDPVRRPPLGCRQRDAERRRADRPGVHRLGLLAPSRHEACPPHVQPRRPDHPRDDRWGRGHRTPGRGIRVRTLRRPAGRLRVSGAGRAASGNLLGERARSWFRRDVVGAHAPRRGVPRLPAVLEAPPHRVRLPQHLVPEAAPARRAAEA